MSGSPVIRFRLKPELVSLLEARGDSASAVAKQIVLDEIKRGPIPVDLLPAVEESVQETALSPETVEEIQTLADAPLPDALLDEAVEAAEEKGGISLVVTERPNPFAGIAPRLGAEPPPKLGEVRETAVVDESGWRNLEEGEVVTEEALRGAWKQLMRQDPGLALDIGDFEEFKRRRESGSQS